VITVTTRVDGTAMTRMLTDPQNGMAARATFRKAKRVEAGAKRRVRVDTGRLRASIYTEMRSITGLPVARVGSDVSYARAVHNGTGIYGPRHRPIRPVHARVLVYRPRGAARVIVAREVRGQRPNHFLTDSLND
jgi:hypothetical protein